MTGWLDTPLLGATVEVARPDEGSDDSRDREIADALPGPPSSDTMAGIRRSVRIVPEREAGVPHVVGVKFSNGPKTYHYDPAGFSLRQGVKVVAESLRGLEIGQVTALPREIPPFEHREPLKPIVRIATVPDLLKADQCREREKVAYDFCFKRIRARELPMKLADAHCALDDGRLTFYFTSEGRVDFRDLVKDLNAQFHARIQLLQIGARDAARLIGGIGPCGQELCCSRWLIGFEPIAMKMAKDQSLFLNPSKFSGVCGKLMCCLRYEHETYLLTRQAMPPIGSSIETQHGLGVIIEQIVPKESVLVEVPDHGLVEVRTPVGVVPTQPRCRGGGGCSASGCGNCGQSGCSSCGADVKRLIHSGTS